MSKEVQEKPQTNWMQLQEFKPENLGQAWKLADIISKTSFKAGHKSAEDIFIAMSMGQQIGLNPFQSVQNISVINGRPSLWGDGLVAVCQSHPDYEGIEENFNKDDWEATCTVKRKGKPPVTETFSKEDAQIAGLWGKSGPWKQYPRKMLRNRARTWALRTQFADALMGLITTEEAQETESFKDMGPIQHETAPAQNEIKIALDSALPTISKKETVEEVKEPEAEVIPPQEEKPKKPKGYKKRVEEFKFIADDAKEKGFDLGSAIETLQLQGNDPGMWKDSELRALSKLVDEAEWK
jgi:hypothetical protein